MIESGNRVWLCGVLGVVAAAGLLSGCKDDLGLTKVGTLVYEPEAFVFGRSGPGVTSDQRVRLRNEGEGPIKLANFKIASEAGEDFDLYWYFGEDDTADQSFGIVDGSYNFPKPLEIPAGDSVTLVLSFTPGGENAASGRIVFETNDLDEDRRDVTIPIETSAAGAELRVTPAAVDFGRIPANTEKEEVLTATNVGGAVLNVSAMQINGSQDFRVRVNGEDPIENPTILADPDGDGDPGLAPQSQFEITVIYAPQVDGPDEGELSILSNDARAPEVKVSLTANGASPCINVTPCDWDPLQNRCNENVDFGAALVGRDTPRPVTIESCGGEALEITRIYLSDDSPAFALDEGNVPELPARLPALVEGEDIPSRTIGVLFHPEDEMAYGGKLIIESNDPLSPRIEVPLLGRGSVNECPAAAVVQETFDVLPLDIITLDGSASTDPDGANGKPTEYTWVVVERPAGSTAEPVERFFNPQRPADGGPMDRADTPTAFFFVDLVGDYRIELHVKDELGAEAPSDSCPQAAAQVLIHAEPNEDIHVQLVWHTPGDAEDETDGEGSDVDLHFLHPRGRAWAVAPLDCYYANSEPDWGPLGAAGDPSLDIDDVNGAGPENINLDEPEDTAALGGTYRVGVHYYRAENFVGGGTWGPSEVTVRIFLAGQQAGEWMRVLERTDHFWEVASIVWTEGDRRVQQINRYYQQVP